MNYLECIPLIFCLLEGSANKTKFIVLRLFYNFFTNPPFAQTKKAKIHGIKLYITVDFASRLHKLLANYIVG